MRDIKFRAWHKKLGQMLTVYVLNWTTKAGLNGELEYEATSKGYYGENEQVLFSPDEVELLQFIGLKDKNAREIYEGDVLALEDTDSDEVNVGIGYVTVRQDPCTTFAAVEYDINRAAYGFVIYGYTEGYDKGFNPISDYDMTLFEIVGNIYQNPELLS